MVGLTVISRDEHVPVTVSWRYHNIWVASGRYGYVPGSVRVKQGQSVQDAVNESQANPAQLFFSVRLPPYLARHPEGGAFGSSNGITLPLGNAGGVGCTVVMGRLRRKLRTSEIVLRVLSNSALAPTIC